MTTPAQDRDQRAALSAPREVGRAVGAEFLPCPFCGCLPEVFPTTSQMGSDWHVGCTGCGSRGPRMRDRAEALAAWNRARRPETAAEATRRRSHQVRDRRRLKAARRSGGGR